ncbi:MAG TPA: preprotein translocase subunit SecA [Steroidobacteraceae bacterium]|nr:preprotein translocase subunit SecA [Steroidobacteraceae bacterium]
MLDTLKRIFGSRNDRMIRGYGRYIRAARDLEPELKASSDEALRGKTEEFRQRLREGAALDDLLPEAFAVVREAASRTLKMRHFDVQLIGGIALHQGKIAEMRTGEGKTLVATLPAYLNALPGEGVHVVTVNEYLAQRDADWMGPVYRFLGLTVGVIKNSQTPQEKREAYACDITYGTNNELGFDYLRDNLAFSLEDRVQRHLAYAIVDEVDSILIDEARTPLIISGPAEESTELYLRINQLVPSLKRQLEEEGPGDFSVEEKTKQVHITEDGHERVEELMLKAGLLREGESLYDPANIRLMHHLNAALRAHALYKRDVEYIVRGGEIIIVDEFTGRTMPGRRWSDGLHQAIEAKEGVRVREENQTVASITFQNYFRLYRKLSGMTGTADTEAPEFLEIYGLEVMVIPTHKPMIRKDMADFVHLTQSDKFKAIIEDVRDCVERQQPVLVGTTSIETSELVSGVLQKEGIEHQVLNAKQHEREAHIVAQAGRPGAVTIATNMAGRGTDIVLGGSLEVELSALTSETGLEADEVTRERVRGDWQVRHEKVVAAGGLHIIGTERHESRRIDNQLRGRSGRQGDPGSSRFYLSMEDNLMRIFGDPVRTQRLLKMAGMKEGEVIESGMLSRQIEKAQRKVEAHNFDIRKQLLLFDDVANDQRKVIYQQRTEIMATADVSPAIRGILGEAIGVLVDQYLPKHAMPSDWDLEGLGKALDGDFNVRVDVKGWLEQEPELEEPALRERLAREVQQGYEAKVSRIDPVLMRHIEKDVMLRTLDAHWRDHLGAMDYLRQGIHLRGFAQQDYRTEYKREAFQMFTVMLDRVKFETVTRLMQIEVRTQEEVDREEEERRRRLMRALHAQHPEMLSALAGGADMPADAGASPPVPAAAHAAMIRGGSRAQGGVDAPGVPPPPPPPDSQGTFVRGERKIGRNEPCPCGSGKKYKHCHGALSSVE